MKIQKYIQSFFHCNHYFKLNLIEKIKKKLNILKKYKKKKNLIKNSNSKKKKYQ